MPKTKEREVEKASTKTSSRTSSKAVAKSSSRATAVATQAKPAASSKLAAKPAVVAKPAAAKSSASSKSAVATKPATASSSKLAATSSKPAAKSSAKLTPVSSKLAAAKVDSRAEKLEKVAQLKCPFSKDELGKWRQQLLSRRSEISSDIAGLEKDAMEAEDGHTTPNHIAERGSDADLQDVSLGIAGEEKDIIWQIDRALRKIDKSSPIPFGLCEYTKEAISRNRLQLIPWTPLSIEGATYMEENNLEVEDLLADE